MRVDWNGFARDDEPYGVLCMCGKCIYLKREELTPPATHVTCPECGFTSTLIAGGDIRMEYVGG